MKTHQDNNISTISKKIATKSTNTKGSKRHHFSYFKCIKQNQQTIINQRTELWKEIEEDKINIIPSKKIQKQSPD